MDGDKLYTLILALQRNASFGHSVERFKLLQTHISYVLLTGPFAYKFKKPVDLGFLDYSSLQKREYFTNAELRLNKRLAPDLYREVVPITGTITAPVFRGTGPVIEYALKMVQFPQQNQLDEVLALGRLTRGHIDGLVGCLVDFQARIPVAIPSSSFGDTERIRAQVLANFDHIIPDPGDDDLWHTLRDIRSNTEEQLDRLTSDFQRRKQEGFIREGHGDLHLTNMVLVDSQVVIFDCIEFNDELRWVDVMSELAFLLMDLDCREREDLARRILNDYLELSGDYTGLRILNFYRVYRSMVRAKVADISRRQSEDEQEKESQRMKLIRHINLAESYSTKQHKLKLIITYGLSGSGKTTVTDRLIEHIGAVRIRSDVERKRLWGLAPKTQSLSRVAEGMYDEAVTEQTYEQLRRFAKTVLTSGYSVIIDATFLKHSHRNAFLKLARDLGISFRILGFYADEATLQSRIISRQRFGRDPSEADLAVLDHQLRAREELDVVEQTQTIQIDTGKKFDIAMIAHKLEAFD